VSDSGVFGVPRVVTDLVHRPALEGRLDDDVMITTIDAGAGFGKTTLLSSWASTHAGAGVWVDGTIGRGDRVSFWNNVFAVVAQAAARTDAAVLRDAVVPDRPVDDPASVSVAVAAFARSLSGPFALVVDGAEALDLDTIGEDLVAFVRFATASHLYVADRRRRFRPTLVASDVTESRLTSEDLRFTVDDTARLLGSRSRDRLPAETVHRLADGIVGLTRRIADAPAKEPVRGVDARDLLQRWIADVGPLVSRDTTPTNDPTASGHMSSSAVRGALMMAALGTTRATESASLTGLPDSRVVAVLNAAGDRGIGSWTDDPAGELFRFAPIVSLAARRSLTDDRESPDWRVIATDLAHLFSRRGDAMNAFVLALEAEDFDLAIAIGKRSFLELVRDDTPGLLRRLKRVPLARLRHYPLLVLFIAILHMQSSRGYAAAMLHFRLAEQLARSSRSTASADDRVIMIGVQSATTRMQGKFDKAVPMARDFLERFDRLSVEEQDRMSSLSRHFLWQVAHTLLFAGDVAGAIGAAQRMLGVPVPTDLDEDRGIHPALTLVAAAHAIEGSMVVAGDVLEEAMTHPPRRSAFHHVWHTTASALAAIERGDFAEARTLVDDLDHDMAADEYWPIDLVVRVMADIGDDRRDSAIDRVRAVLTGDSPRRQAVATRDTLIMLFALLSLAGRPSGTAPSVLRHVSRPGPLRWLVDATIALQEGDFLKAAGHTRNVVSGGVASTRVLTGALLVRAAALCGAQQRDAAERAAHSAFNLMEANGLATPWLLLSAAQRADVRAIIADRDISEDLLVALGRMPVVFGAAATVERLTAREQEVLAHLVAGTTIPEIAKASGVSPNTIKTQRARIYRKLGVDNRADAARVALEHDLI
jgi:LuxR family maltose regulon positive regulatory protein